MTAKLRWGVLSTAKIGVKAVIPAIQRFGERSEVVAISSRDGAAAEQAAGHLGIPRAHAGYEALLADPDVDAVYNPLPNHLHAEWTMRAAAAGKHVLCEKPLALHAAEAQEMVDYCEAAGVRLQEAFMYRFHPQWVAVRQAVVDGEIGEVRAVQGWFSYFNRNPDDIRNIPAYGGGALMDIGCYPISVSRLVFGAEPDQVQAVILRDPDFGIDVVTSAVLRFGDGHATFTVSTQAEHYQRVHVSGSEGRIEVEVPFNAPSDRPARVVFAKGGNAEVREYGPADHYALQADAFAAAVLDGTAVPLPPSDAVANMTVIDCVFAAAR